MLLNQLYLLSVLHFMCKRLYKLQSKDISKMSSTFVPYAYDALKVLTLEMQSIPKMKAEVVLLTIQYAKVPEISIKKK